MSKPHLLLCGPDMCAKTHIGHELSKRLGVPYYKASSEKGAFLNKQERFIMDLRYSCPARFDLLKQIGCGVVFDRGYPCEWVYSTYFNRPTDYDALRELDDKWSSEGLVMVFCTRRSFDGIVDDLNPKLQGTELKRIHGLYVQYFKTCTLCKVITIEVDDHDLDRQVTEIISQLLGTHVKTSPHPLAASTQRCKP